MFDDVYNNGTTGTVATTDVVKKTWMVDEAITGGSNVTLTLQWNVTDEATGFDRTSCGIRHYINSAWDSLTYAAASGSNPYTISRSGITSFSPFAVSKSGTPLPIELLTFDAKLNDQIVDLYWQTALETNNDYFTIERSVDAIHFEELLKIKGAGNSTTTLNYYALDNSPLNGISYYRLKQTDYDGKYEYSKFVSVEFTSSHIKTMETYYDFGIIVKLSGFEDEKGKIIVQDIVGKEYYSNTIITNYKEPTSIKINENLPTGVYIVIFITDKKINSKKIIVE